MDMEFGSNEYGGPTFGLMKAGVVVQKYDEPKSGEELDGYISTEFDRVCDAVEDKYVKHGTYPATLLGFTPGHAFQMDAVGFERTPDPTTVAYAIMQHMAQEDMDKPQGFMFVLEAVKANDSEGKDIVGTILFVFLTTRAGDHRVCTMDIDTSNPSKHKIGKRNDVQFIYQLDTPMNDIWKVWNPDEDFGSSIQIIKNLPPGTNLNDLFSGDNKDN